MNDQTLTPPHERPRSKAHLLAKINRYKNLLRKKWWILLLGAIIESGEGNVFIKMTGPIAVVKSSKETFKKMVEEPLK